MDGAGQVFDIGRPDDAVFGDDGGDIAVRRDVEGGVAGGSALGHHGFAFEVQAEHLVRVALFDGDQAALRQRQVHGGGGRDAIERHAVLLGQHRHAVGADLVGKVAVGDDAVGADQAQVDLAAVQEVAGGIVGDEVVGDASLL